MGILPTPEEQAILDRGTISEGTVVVGAFSAAFLGFGTGQAIERRWRSTGWLFTLADVVAGGAMTWGWVGGTYSCLSVGPCSYREGVSYDVLAYGGLALAVVSRVWQIADAAHGPTVHNAKVHELRYRYGLRDYAKTLAPYVARPQAADGGMTFGVAMQF